MSDDGAADEIVVDGTPVRFHSGPDGVRVEVGEAGASARVLGELQPTANGESFAVRLASGDFLTRPSPWGGPVTARFQTRELAVRALLDADEA